MVTLHIGCYGVVFVKYWVILVDLGQHWVIDKHVGRSLDGVAVLHQARCCGDLRIDAGEKFRNQVAMQKIGLESRHQGPFFLSSPAIETGLCRLHPVHLSDG